MLVKWPKVSGTFINGLPEFGIETRKGHKDQEITLPDSGSLVLVKARIVWTQVVGLMNFYQCD